MSYLPVVEYDELSYQQALSELSGDLDVLDVFLEFVSKRLRQETANLIGREQR